MFSGVRLVAEIGGGKLLYFQPSSRLEKETYYYVSREKSARVNRRHL
jgi:hypothetical protein